VDIRKIALFTMMVVLFSFFYVTLQADVTGNAVKVEPVVRIDSASCKWKDDHFEVCAAVSWDADQTFYAQAYIAGGDPLSKAPRLVNNPSVYCQDVGSLESKRAVNGYLFNTAGALKALSVDTVVACSQDVIATTSGEAKKFLIEARNEYRMRPTNTGEVVLTGFSGKPISCSVTGTFVTNDRRLDSSAGTCHKASGTFNGLYDEGIQQVLVDPLPFAWTGVTGLFSDPDPVVYEGFVGYMTFCDRLNYKSGKYFARFSVKDVTDDALTLAWEYFNEQLTKVDFSGEVICDVESVVPEEVVDIIDLPVVVPVVEEPVVESVVPIEEPLVGTPLQPSWLERMFVGVRSWFS